MGTRGQPKVRSGVVIGNKMDKTVSISITRVYQHPVYRKIIKTSSKVLAHDANNDCQLGDLVQVCESRPLSRRKRWRVQKVLERAD